MPPLPPLLLLAWRPFLDPLELHEYWWAFIVPLALGVSLSYKAVRVPEIRAGAFTVTVLKMTAQIILGMILLGAAGYLLLGYVIPTIISMGR